MPHGFELGYSLLVRHLALGHIQCEDVLMDEVLGGNSLAAAAVEVYMGTLQERNRCLHQQKKTSRLSDLSEKKGRVFSSLASLASLVPLCRLSGKKARCNFLNEKKSEIH